MFGGSFMLKFEWTGFNASSVERRVIWGWVVGLIHAKFKEIGLSASSLEGGVV